MKVNDLVARVVGTCDFLGLRYYVTGSVASMAWGHPRLTEDVGVVVELPPDAVPHFCKAFADLYVDEVGAVEAARRHGSFNIIAPEAGLKIDVYCAGRSPTEQLRLERARNEQVRDGLRANFSSPEDCVLSKMEFFRIGGSQKHVRDIFGIIDVQRANLDTAYIDRQADQLGLSDIWVDLKAGRRPKHDADTY